MQFVKDYGPCFNDLSSWSEAHVAVVQNGCTSSLNDS